MTSFVSTDVRTDAVRSTSPGPPSSGETIHEAYARLAAQFDDRRPADAFARALDVVIAATALVGLSPLLLVIAIAIGVTGGRPIFYRGGRVGRAGRLFTMVKFRTLHVDAEARLADLYGQPLTEKTAAEETGVGKLLRATHLDEIPQLWNVLRGDMSIVGPRPIRPLFFESLVDEIPQYWQRLVARPGMTGFAQLRMTRETTWSEKLVHDLEYVADRSLRLYLTIVATTAWRIVVRPLRGRPGAVPRAS